MARKRDLKQFDDACREVGLTEEETYEASEAFHAEKEASGNREDWSYRELMDWLRQWKEG